jgi:hypothetical protein
LKSCLKQRTHCVCSPSSKSGCSSCTFCACSWDMLWCNAYMCVLFNWVDLLQFQFVVIAPSSAQICVLHTYCYLEKRWIMLEWCMQ